MQNTIFIDLSLSVFCERLINWRYNQDNIHMLIVQNLNLVLKKIVANILLIYCDCDGDSKNVAHIAVVILFANSNFNLKFV